MNEDGLPDDWRWSHAPVPAGVVPRAKSLAAEVGDNFDEASVDMMRFYLGIANEQILLEGGAA